MKNFGKIFLVVLLTLITVAAGVFGYFFFSGKDYYDYLDTPESGKLSRAEAKTLVTRAITDINNINNTTSAASQTLSIDFSDQYEDYESDRFDTTYTAISCGGYLKIIKFLLEDENTKENTNYFCVYDEIQGSSLSAVYSIIEDGIIVEFNQPGYYYYNYDKYVYECHYLLKLFKGTEGDGSWTLEGFIEVVEGGNRTVAEYLKLYAKNENIYRLTSVAYNKSNSGTAIATGLFDQNRELGKKFYQYPSNMEEHITMVDKQFEGVTFKDWENETQIEYDFSEALVPGGDSI